MANTKPNLYEVDNLRLDDCEYLSAELVKALQLYQGTIYLQELQDILSISNNYNQLEHTWGLKEGTLETARREILSRYDVPKYEPVRRGTGALMPDHEKKKLD